jgi:hypothetical protein
VASHAPCNAEIARTIIAEKQEMPGAFLPILHALQEEFGYIDREAEPIIADILYLPRAEFHGVVTFYHDFRAEPAGHVLKRRRAYQHTVVQISPSNGPTKWQGDYADLRRRSRQIAPAEATA